MRFPVNIPDAEAFITRFVRTSIPAGSEEQDRHRHFLAFCGLASGCGLATVPLLIAGNQSAPDIWFTAAAAAAIPFFAGLIVPRSGQLDTALNFLALMIATMFGFAIVLADGLAVPMILIAAFVCIEPVQWRMRWPAAKGLAMGLIVGAIVLVGKTFGIAAAAYPAPVSVFWMIVLAYAGSSIVRLTLNTARLRDAAKRDRASYEMIVGNTSELVTAHDRYRNSTAPAQRSQTSSSHRRNAHRRLAGNTGSQSGARTPEIRGSE